MAARAAPRHLLVDHGPTQLPFLYITRTLIAPYQGRLLARRCQYSTKSSAVRAEGNQPEGSSSSTESPTDWKERDLPPELLSLGSLPNVEQPDGEHGHRYRSTITPAERKAFQEMFQKVTSNPEAENVKAGDLSERLRLKARLREIERAKQKAHRVKTEVIFAAQEEISDIFSERTASLPPPSAVTKSSKTHSKRNGKDSVEHEAKMLPGSTLFIEKLAEFADPDMNKKSGSKERRGSGQEQQRRSRTRSRSPRLTDAQSTIGKRTQRILQEFRDMQVNSEGMSPFELGRHVISVAQREIKEIRQAMDDSVASEKGDVGIWKICETQVFPMLDLVKPENLEGSSLTRCQAQEASVQSFTRAKSQRNAKKAAESHENVGSCTLQQTDTTDAIPATHDSTVLPPIEIRPNVAIITILAAVYPEVLVYALQSLRKHYAHSPFSTRLYDTVKSHSRLSYLLGATTEFYNELIFLRWKSYKDLPEVMSLIEEMNVTGVPFDNETALLLDFIRKDCQRAAHVAGTEGDEDGSAGHLWWRYSKETHLAWKELVGTGDGGTGWLEKIKLEKKPKETAKRSGTP